MQMYLSFSEIFRYVRRVLCFSWLCIYCIIEIIRYRGSFYMYFIERSKIYKTLVYIDTLLHEFEQCSFDTPLAQLGLERITHMLIESILDVGNMMIDGFIMCDPGSYEDIIYLLVDG